MTARKVPDGQVADSAGLPAGTRTQAATKSESAMRKPLWRIPSIFVQIAQESINVFCRESWEREFGASRILPGHA